MLYIVCFTYRRPNSCVSDTFYFKCPNEMALFVVEATSRGCEIEHIETTCVWDAERSSSALKHRGVPELPKSKKNQREVA